MTEDHLKSSHREKKKVQKEKLGIEKKSNSTYFYRADLFGARKWGLPVNIDGVGHHGSEHDERSIWLVPLQITRLLVAVVLQPLFGAFVLRPKCHVVMIATQPQGYRYHILFANMEMHAI